MPTKLAKKGGVSRGAHKDADPPPVVQSFAHSMKIEHKLTIEHLTTLMKAFDVPQSHIYGLDMEEFSTAVLQLLGVSLVNLFCWHQAIAVLGFS
jgi:hypothetical protein